jgi:UMP-CMP kinase
VQKCEFVLFFDCPLEAMEARITHRAQQSGDNVRVDDNPETLKKRFNTYLKETMPVITHYQQQNKLRKVEKRN